MSEIPFIKLIKTPFGKYAYDVNKNQMIHLNDELYDYFASSCKGDVSDNIKVQIEELKKKGYLSSFHIQKIRHPESDNIRFHIEKNIEQLTIQVTQQCNFRCSYCPYTTAEFDSQREHGTKQMSLKTAKKSIDFLAEHSKDQESVAVGFYGGEPLLRYDLIKEVTEYAEEKFFGKGISFTVTTNGSLLTEDIVEFLIDHEFQVMISLDGPPEVHNRSRKFAASGRGTFAVIEKNLLMIQEKYPEFLEKLSINVVIDPRFSANSLHEMFSKSIFEKLNIQSTLIDDFFCIERTVSDERYLKEENIHEFRAMMSMIGKYPKEKVSKLAYNSCMGFFDDIKKKMKPSTGLAPVMAPGGPCVPGQRRLFVNVDGALYPCERISETSDIMRIGDIYNGIDHAKVDALLNIGQLTEEKCKHCYAVRYCTLCAKNCDNNGELSPELKASNCQSVHNEVMEKFRDYLFTREFSIGEWERI